MKKTPKMVVYGVLALVFLVQMACEFFEDRGQEQEEIECAAMGGIWDASREFGQRCRGLPNQQSATKDANTPASAPTQPVATPTSSNVVTGGDCIAPKDAYTWSYEDFRKSSGSGGVACNARFVFKNEVNESLYLIIHTAFNNNKLQGNKWETHPVRPGGEWELRVNRAIYKDGVITYTNLDRMLVVWDNSACKRLHTNQHQSTWEAMAAAVEDITCSQ